MRSHPRLLALTLTVLSLSIFSGCGSGSAPTGKLTGAWHLDKEQVSGRVQEADEKEAYSFNADGSFSHSLDKQKDGKNVKTDSGKWELKDDRLVLTNASGKSHGFKIVIADKQFTIDTSDDEKQIYVRD